MMMMRVKDFQQTFTVVSSKEIFYRFLFLVILLLGRCSPKTVPVHASHGTLTDGNFLSSFGHQESCSWIITNPFPSEDIFFELEYFNAPEKTTLSFYEGKNVEGNLLKRYFTFYIKFSFYFSN